MKHFARKLLTQVGSLTIGAGLIAANGTYMFTKNIPVITHAAPVPSVESSSYTENLTTYADNDRTEQLSVLTMNAVELPKPSEYSKASISDYQMLLKIDRVKVMGVKGASKAVEAYTLDTTKIYDPQPEPMNFKETRSVENEYFTVDDIISGNRVTMNAHELLCQAVFNEIGGDWDADAVKAQVVACYSYLRFNDSIGLVPTVGLKSNYPKRIEKCVSQVEGQAVYYDKKIINAVYSASTAGYSIESERIWEVYYPYLRAVVSEYDYEDPNYGLEYEFTEQEVRSLLEQFCSITLSDDMDKWFEMDDIYSGMYVGYVNIDGQKRITARNMQEIFGLKSQSFTVEHNDGTFLFKSFGWGHGVGMSQWGACYYAEHGYTYDQILRHYYLDTTIGLSTESRKAVKRGEALFSSTEEEEESVSEQSSSSEASESSVQDY
ncbi:MAG: SpoIID/LytB domain-containing protein [Oscillospiraceae bacterium]